MLLRKPATLGSCRRTNTVSVTQFWAECTQSSSGQHLCLFPLSLPPGPRSAPLSACSWLKIAGHGERRGVWVGGGEKRRPCLPKPREAKARGEESQRLPPSPGQLSTPCALTTGFSRKASSPFNHLGIFRMEIRSPKQGSTKSPLLGDKGSSPALPPQASLLACPPHCTPSSVSSIP